MDRRRPGATGMVLAVLWLSATLVASDPPLRVVDSMDLKRYAGRWYEVARLPTRFQRHCASDVVVTYALRDDGRIDVVNRCKRSDGSLDEVHGVARKGGDGRKPARLEVRFAPAFLSFLPMVWGDYWVIGLGPDYTWAVVGVPSREQLWILSRAPAMSAGSYAQALEIAKGNGFDTTRLIRGADLYFPSRDWRIEI